ncbi:sensor histidine kinase [Microaerobacter geothermalis]|uniref:sensor histidine kinase n=1 Tax=Microaerobacter geothermalis TaxID=674972 RepID=UPI001F3EBC26|nr:sensor histidine kinase [Microaerobacter geothermalis]MCF6094992.1 sensor histidine kinase [Microaerobacter geothermalis]
MVFDLMITLGQGMSVVATIAFLLTRLPLVQRLFRQSISLKDKFLLILIFGGMGIIGTYTGVLMDGGAIANSRVIGVMVGGLFGGPVVGIGAGLLAGAHRLTLGGFTALACGIATTVEGLIGGIISKKIRKERLNWRTAFLAGLLAEFVQMLIILLIAKPFDKAWDLVMVIGIPMIFVNALGISIFVVIVQMVFKEWERAGAVQAQKSLKIAQQTLPFLRKGLTEETARKVSQIIYHEMDFDAVAITNLKVVLAHVGVGSDHHHPGTSLRTLATTKYLNPGKPLVAKTREEMSCTHPGCPLFTALVVPLRNGKEVIGALKLYYNKKREFSRLDHDFAVGLAHLFSSQLELASLEYQSQLLTKAEIKALQAQIQPHFLFNALNTIVSFSRTSPETARSLLIHLGNFLRRNLEHKDLVPLKTELEHIHAYLAIEKARFGDRLIIKWEIEEQSRILLVPPLILQPLVENAIKHGILPRKSGGTIQISTMTLTGNDGKLFLKVRVDDNGVGMEEGISSTKKGLGIGLTNVNERLKAMYGEESTLSIKSTAGVGTSVSFMIPASESQIPVERNDHFEGSPGG